MATAGTRNDGLRLLDGATEIAMRVVMGSLAGVVMLAAAARNGPGAGRLSLTEGRYLTYLAPGSETPGDAVDVSGGGDFLIEDGDDESKWVRVSVYPDYLPEIAAARVLIDDAYNGLGLDDVDASEALAGATEDKELTLSNVSGGDLQNVKLWIDPAAPATLWVSTDGVTFVRPTSDSDPDVLTWLSIVVDTSVSVWIRRVIDPDTEKDPGILNFLQYEWQGL